MINLLAFIITFVLTIVIGSAVINTWGFFKRRRAAKKLIKQQEMFLKKERIKL